MYERPLVDLVGLDVLPVVTCLQYILHTKQQRIDEPNCDLQSFSRWVQPVQIENAQALQDLHLIDVEPHELPSIPGLGSDPKDA